ncbi:hypothetical protein AB0E69_22905 [Kribbella sp. NPDC026611]|uniref:hypothetical protein n=1 Tax=Kribbella sp. NPDC026611 TaxID=3154911 RepID=UPI0033E46802
MSETDFEGPDFDAAFDAEHDIDEETPETDVPTEADPADVEEQRREVADDDEDDYR